MQAVKAKVFRVGENGRKATEKLWREVLASLSARAQGDAQPDQQSKQSGGITEDDQSGCERKADCGAESPGGTEDEGKQEERGQLQQGEGHASGGHGELGRAWPGVLSAGCVGRLDAVAHGKGQGEPRGEPHLRLISVGATAYFEMPSIGELAVA